MRPFSLLLLLLLVGLAGWLVWKKLPPEPKPRIPNPPTDPPPPPHDSLSVYYPRSTHACQIVVHTYYALCYDEEHEQPRWTVHLLEGQRLKAGRVRRTQDFRPDPQVASASAQLADYRGSGYDRGHLVPAGDFKWDSLGMSETFFLSNMSPQLHEFNAGIWEAVERTVREWAKQKGRLVVYTGPVLDRIQGKIGASRVSIPRAFYKILYSAAGNETKAVAFLVPHASSKRPPTDFLVSVDSVERLTQIDFYPALPDAIEELAESRVDKRFWLAGAKRH
ncbi:MAG: DNA/RNA non-specific endonuclease [Bacteroidia bacterium]|nr:DNA/RNA non-specific endonuclease [Bacteroidia bacterium]MDW8089078.1 DNA/RNA non-specific endonuclease [Bacteroidia bacterium]